MSAWLTADSALTLLSVEEFGRKDLLELPREDVAWKCVGARLVET